MELQRTNLEIRYSKIPNQFLFNEKLLKVITGDDQSQAPSLNANVNVRIEDKKASIVVMPNRVIIATELSDKDEASGSLITLIGRLNGILAFEQVNFVGVRCMYMKKSKKDSATIKSEFKDKYLKSTPITDLSTDYALPLKMQHGRFGVNFTYGPMEGEELNNYLEFKRDKLPKSYYYLDLDFYVTEMKKISKKAITAHLAEVFAGQEELISKL